MDVERHRRRVSRRLAHARPQQYARPPEGAEQLIAEFAAKGVYNKDMHWENIMTDGNGNFKCVDLDSIKFNQDSAEAYSAMMAFWQESLNWEIISG